ncbi:MAG: hypothetical protein M1829_000340 [Trizodia sp. TS-e1964]|nr:MAG: hypothetical protein M1829_000340 [Trizodia sp. TS-e1964]
MSLLTSPTLPPALRLAQLFVSVLFIALLIYSSTHRGYWLDLSPPLALGVITFLLTLPCTCLYLFRHFRHLPAAPASGFFAHLLVRLVPDVLLSLAWLGTAILFFKPKGTDYSIFLDTPPVAAWGVASACACVLRALCDDRGLGR